MDNLKWATSYDEFDTDTYYKNFRAPLTSTGAMKDELVFFLNELHDIFKSGSISGDCLLDVGTGASVMSFLSASRFVREIHLSDLLPRHRDRLQKWLNGEDIENGMVEYITAKEKDGKSSAKRLAELRRKVTKIKFIDVTNRPPLQEEDGQYDIITSTFCIEVASATVSQYKTAIENVGMLVKNGGFMVLIGTLKEKFYVVGNVKFWNACITENDVTSALTAVGFTIVYWKNERKIPDNKSELDSFFIVVAKKV